MNDILLYVIITALVANAMLKRTFGEGWERMLGEHLKAWWVRRDEEPEPEAEG